MRDIAIKQIFSSLEKRGLNLSQLKALDFFAREGDWQTASYASLVGEIHAWEVCPEFEENLRKNLPEDAKISIGDSHRMAKETQEKFDLIVIDNPQGCYGETYCEHFDALSCALSLLDKSGVIIFNVKTSPYNYSGKEEWKKRRDEFYGRESSCLDLDFIESFYQKKMSEMGFLVEYSFLVERPQEENLFSYVAYLKRTVSEVN